MKSMNKSIGTETNFKIEKNYYPAGTILCPLIVINCDFYSAFIIFVILSVP